MAMFPASNELKIALERLRHIDESLQRIAVALETQNELQQKKSEQKDEKSFYSTSTTYPTHQELYQKMVNISNGKHSSEGEHNA